MIDNRPQILCFHGGGTSAAIFAAQTRHIRSALQFDFTFIFIDAPIPSMPGPGVLPYFEDSGPYFRWFSDDLTTEATRMSELEAVNRAVETELWREGRRTSDIAGLMGFSQGSLIASLILRQSQNGDPRWSGLRLGTLLCGGGREDILMLMGEGLRIPSVHLCGSHDPWVLGSRNLAKCFHPEVSTIMEFEGGHHVPTESKDIKRLAALMIKVSRQS